MKSLADHSQNKFMELLMEQTNCYRRYDDGYCAAKRFCNVDLFLVSRLTTHRHMKACALRVIPGYSNTSDPELDVIIFK